MTHPTRLLFALLVLSLCSCDSGAQAIEPEQGGSAPIANSESDPTDPVTADQPMTSDSFHSLSTRSLEGEEVALSRYAGKALLVVNVASECGLTPQYEGLQALHEEIGGDDFAIVAFPSNDFGAQEPGSAAQIRSFCTDNYNVSFDMMEKVSTKSGEVYDWLNDKTGERPSWNFSKFLVSKDGTEVQFFDPRTTPEDSDLRAAIDRLRAQ
ncbi:MAG: glutathione peroxidase [Planctomycetota bacterium]